MKTSSKTALLTLATLFATSAVALAHPHPDDHVHLAEHGSFLTGFLHPLFGPDHVLAMVAVGLWASMSAGSALLIVPAAFVAAMMVGFGLSMAGVPLPLVEPGILASVVVIGLLVALAVRIPVAASAALVGLFALFHGHAHGAEMGSATAFAYMAGFAIATALLHLAGVGLGLVLGGLGSLRLTRLLGAATAAAGLVLMVQP